MNILSIIMAFFAVLGALDYIFGNKLKLGHEFEKGILLLGQLVLSMTGLIIIAPTIADILSPFFDFVYNTFKIDPSIIPASIFANDMGGAPLAKEVAKDQTIGMFNAMVVSSMMGATISYTIPLSLGCVKNEKHKELMLGLLCGIVTIPIGCIFSGIVCKIPPITLMFNLLPLLIFAIIIAISLWFAPNKCIKIFNVLGLMIKTIATVGLILGITELLIGFKPIKSAANMLESTEICINAAIVLSGAFTLLTIFSKILSKPMEKLGNTLKINKNSTLGFISTLANNVPTFKIMDDMDSKGAVLNSAFAVSGAFVLGDQLAFTLAFEPSYLLPMLIAKIISGLSAIIFAIIIFKKTAKTFAKEEIIL